jgi:hypothetical protein
MKSLFKSIPLDLLIETNEVIITAEIGDAVQVTPYRGKHNRGAIETFLGMAGKKARAIVYSHESAAGPIGRDVQSGELLTWVSL